MLKSFGFMSLISVATAASSLCFAGDGGGHNGPNLAPKMVPVQLDRGITVVMTERAVNACAIRAEGKNPAKGDSLTSRLFAQIYGTELPIMRDFADLKKMWVTNVDFDSAHAQRYNYRKVEFRTHHEYDFYYTYKGGCGHSKNFDPMDDLYPGRAQNHCHYTSGEIAADASTSQFTFEFPRPVFDAHGAFSNVGRKIKLKIDLPTLVLGKEVKDSGYDEYGVRSSDRVIYQGAKIQLPKEYGTAVHLKNESTNYPSELTVNLEEYTECLKTQLQQEATRE